MKLGRNKNIIIELWPLNIPLQETFWWLPISSHLTLIHYFVLLKKLQHLDRSGKGSTLACAYSAVSLVGIVNDD